MRDNTRLVWCESPGSITMEVQDVPAIAEAAHQRAAMVALDNTYSAGVYFDAFAHGVDVTSQALTKYIGGHSDLLLGSVTVRDTAGYERVGSTLQLLGMAVSPDDCSLALRGMQTLAVRLERLERSTLEVARWLATRPEIERVLHPALPSCPGHEFWRRDFTGSTSVFSVVSRRSIGASAFTPSSTRSTCSRSAGVGAASPASRSPVNPPRTTAPRADQRDGPIQHRPRGAGRPDRGSRARVRVSVGLSQRVSALPDTVQNRT